MAETEHILERRANLLAQKMQHRVDMISQFLTPAGSRAPFTKQLQNDQALRWWLEHRHDHLGARVLQGMRPSDIAELDTALAMQVESQQASV